MKKAKWMMLCDLVLSDRFTNYLEIIRKRKSAEYLSISVPFENMDPLAVLELNGDAEGTRFYWERPDYDLAMAAGGKVAVIKASGQHRFSSISRQSRELLNKTAHYSGIRHSLAGTHLVGGFSFFDHNLSGSWSPLGNSSFVLPEWLLVRDGQFSMLTITRRCRPEEPAGDLQEWYINWMERFQSRLHSRLELGSMLGETHDTGKSISVLPTNENRHRWIQNIQRARSLIRSGLFNKIVLSRELRIQTEKRVSATKLLHYLRKTYPGCYSFLFQLNGQAIFLGSTPEKLFSLQKQYLKTEALAGSISRGKTATQDTINEKKLLASIKDLEEHAYVLDAIREKLEPVAASLDHSPLPSVKKYANVQHLYTPVAASLEKIENPLDLVALLHPTPAVGGYPERDALPYIQQLEQMERGWYAGPVGWFNTNHRAEFSVAIRSALIRNRHIQLFAGCGIVEHSNPETEWMETELKFMPMQKGLHYAME